MQIVTDSLYSEYASMVKHFGVQRQSSDLVKALVEQCDWTSRGAEIVVMLAQQYGMFVLRNALALAAALEIEDGASGL
jgi:hypothetical protein